MSEEARRLQFGADLKFATVPPTQNTEIALWLLLLFSLILFFSPAATAGTAELQSQYDAGEDFQPPERGRLDERPHRQPQQFKRPAESRRVVRVFLQHAHN